MFRCIYCLQYKGLDGFKKREHVLPESFGAFEGNLTLFYKVCDDCNQKFGDTIERILGRDTIEGSARFDFGVKEPNEFKHMGPNAKIQRVVHEDGILKGIILGKRISNSGKLEDFIIPQVGFLKRDGLYEYMPLENIPDAMYTNEVYDLKSEKGVFFPPDVDRDEAMKALKEKGFKINLGPEVMLDAQDRVITKSTRPMDDDICRAYAKIAFNYLAKFNTAEVMLQKDFDVCRNYILHGNVPPWPIVMVSNEPILCDESPNDRRVIHIVNVDWGVEEKSIVAQISLFNYYSYSVCLAREYEGGNIEVGFGHYFNPNSGIIEKLGQNRAL